MSNLLSIYIHIPFCRTRCGYCDFNTYAGYDHLKDAYVNAVVEEIARTSEKIDDRYLVHTIYFGGGTPNFLSSNQLEKIINGIRENFHCISGIELSAEANPTCLSDEYLISLMEIGINRLSLGMQSASASDLKVLGRSHSFKDVETNVGNAREAGISNLNLDLIFGIPFQSLKSFETTLKAAIGLSPDHLSLYALTVEDSTPLAIQIANGELPQPDDDLEADMYIMASEFLENQGFAQYEISNWARDSNRQCMHNLQYWRNLDYLGFGAGAHSHYMQLRWENQKTITDYIDSVTKNSQNTERVSPAGINFVSLSDMDEISETMMMGMRLTQEGISAEDFVKRFGIGLEEVFTKEISKLQSRELVEWVVNGDCRVLRLTQKGRLLGNQVFLEFIRD